MQHYTIFVKQTGIILIFSIHQDNSYFYMCILLYYFYFMAEKLSG